MYEQRQFPSPLTPIICSLGYCIVLGACYTIISIVVSNRRMVFPFLNIYRIEIRRKCRDSHLGVTWSDPLFRNNSVIVTPCMLSKYLHREGSPSWKNV
jgi:hypothetical protein